jgi:threonine dehydratase
VITRDDIRATYETIRPYIRRTPVVRLDLGDLDPAAGEVPAITLKLEQLQCSGSFKARGAFANLLLRDVPPAGVVAASGGNHGVAVAYAAHRLGLPARIFVPTVSAAAKIERIRQLGAELVVTGDRYADALAAAQAWVETSGAMSVHAFDQRETLLGQGTVALELTAQAGGPDGGGLDTVLVPVGGGGLIGGLAAYLRERAPQTAIIGAEPSGAASMIAALAAGGPVTLEEISPFVDGAAVRRVGELPYQVLSGVPHTMLTVDEGAVCTEMLELYQQEGIIAEPAGALAPAALPQAAGLAGLPAGARVVALVSGGNNDVSRYGEVIERSLLHRGLKHYFLVEFAQQPGELRRFLDEVLGPDDDITLFEYVKRNNRETGPALVGIELGSADGLDALLGRMKASPMRIEQIDPGSPAYAYLT